MRTPLPLYAVVITALLGAIGLLLPGASFAETPIPISSNNFSQFFNLNDSNDPTLVCRKLSPSRARAGRIILRDYFGLEIKAWKSYTLLIRESSKRKDPKSQIKALQRERTSFNRACKQTLLSLNRTPAPTRTATPPNGTPVATQTPTVPVGTPTRTPTLTPTFTRTATFSPTFTPTFTPTATFTPTPQPTSIYIRCGGPNYLDEFGRLWRADDPYLSSAGNTYATTQAIQNTATQEIYKKERFGMALQYQIALPVGVYNVKLHFAEIYFGQASSRVFNLDLEGSPLLQNFDIFAQVGSFTAYQVESELVVSDGALNINLTSVVDNAKLSAIEISPHAGDNPYLHAVIKAPSYVVDYDGNGAETVLLDGNASHTHELGGSITSYQWQDGSSALGSGKQISPALANGAHLIRLTILDQHLPAQSTSAEKVLNVYPINRVGGAYIDYFNAGVVDPIDMIDSLPAASDYLEISQALKVENLAGKIGGSPFSANVVVKASGSIELSQSGSYNFTPIGGALQRLFIDGTPFTGARSLSAGSHQYEVRFAVQNLTQLPLELKYTFNAGAQQSVSPSQLYHNQTNLKPFIQSMPRSGNGLGGEEIIIRGLGLFPRDQVSVHWGSLVLQGAQIQVTQDQISFVSPPGSGAIDIQVETPLGLSNTLQYTYDTLTPIQFSAPQTIASPNAPTQAAWGPDGRLYVASLYGEIFIYQFDQNYNVLSTQIVPGVSLDSSSQVLGIAFNPLDPPSPVKVYLSHSRLYAAFPLGEGCAPIPDPFPYSGKVSVLQGPDFSAPQTLITGLPVSNHDHAVNGLVFDNYGDLYIAVGGNTNAGVMACAIGLLPESPLSGAILKAEISRPGFNGSVQYQNISDGTPNQDARFGEVVKQSVGSHVSVYASGFRNPFEVLFTTEGKLFATDNGPNPGFGVASISATQSGSEPGPSFNDDLDLLIQGHYYGHANRSRGTSDARQNIFRGPYDPYSANAHTPPLMPETFPASTNGVDQYRATSFGSQLRGSLIAKRYTDVGQLYAVKLGASGTTIADMRELAQLPGLDLVSGPAGALLFTDLPNNHLDIIKPVDAGIAPFQVIDLFPWRGSAGGDVPFVISGTGFGSIANTSVHFDGVDAVLTTVTPTQIKGLVPARASPSSDLVDVHVHVGAEEYQLERAFRYVFPPGAGLGSWKASASMPIALREVAAASVNGVLYVVGAGNSKTLAYDPARDAWQTNLSVRPFIGDHHAALEINSKLYLFGGMGGSSGNKVQIYDPQTNTWSTGASAPFALSTGASAVAMINGLVYYAGGTDGLTESNQLAAYNPNTNTWSLLAPMPFGRHHAAGGTDGQKLYVFGGRVGPNIVSAALDDVQIYDPSTNSWSSSQTPGSGIPAMPSARAGAGQAVFFRGELYVIGGESSVSGVGQVYSTVSAFNPVSRTWRNESSLPVARHGIYPALLNNQIAVAGGAEQPGAISPSFRLESFSQ